MQDQRLKPGGTDGGGNLFLLGIGLLLSALSLYLLMDSFRVTTGGGGFISGAMRGRGGGGGAGRGGMGTTTSMGVIFLPFFIGVVGLFYNARLKWAWGLMWVGIAIILIEMFSRIRFQTDMKVSHLVLILTMFAAGIGFTIRSLRDFRESGLEEQLEAERRNFDRGVDSVVGGRDKSGDRRDS